MTVAVAVLCAQAGLPQSAVVAAHGNFDSEWPAEHMLGQSRTPAWLHCRVTLAAQLLPGYFICVASAVLCIVFLFKATLLLCSKHLPTT
jgi:hypothetical protein